MFCCVSREEVKPTQDDHIQTLQTDLPQSAGHVYYADNSRLRADSDGIGYRMSRDLKDHDPTKLLVPWGERIFGELDDHVVYGANGRWLKVWVAADTKKHCGAGYRYLPLVVENIEALRRIDEPMTPGMRGYGAPPADAPGSQREDSSSPRRSCSSPRGRVRRLNSGEIPELRRLGEPEKAVAPLDPDRPKCQNPDCSLPTWDGEPGFCSVGCSRFGAGASCEQVPGEPV